MSTRSQRLWFTGKLLLTLVVMITAFAIAIPNSIVPATVSHPQSFVWSDLIAPLLVSGIGIYCIWLWKWLPGPTNRLQATPRLRYFCRSDTLVAACLSRSVSHGRPLAI